MANRAIVQGSARWGARRRRRMLAATVMAALVSAALVAVPAVGAGASPEPGADCGTKSDTPPAYELGWGERCEGSLHLEPTALDGDCLTDEPCRLDRYTFFAEVDHAVAVWFSDTCRGDVVAHTDSTRDFRKIHTGYYFAAPHTGLHTIHVQAPASACEVPIYSIRAQSYANLRPEVLDHGAVPATVKPGDTITVPVTARDRDGNLEQTGIEMAAPGAPADPLRSTWGHVDVATGMAAHTVMVTNRVQLWAHAQDGFSAKATPVDAGTIELVEDDCGTGADITSHALTLGASCRAYLAGDLGDDRDTFTIDVPAGLSQLAVRLDPVTPGLNTRATLVAPSGATAAAAVPGPVMLAEAGTWTLHVDRLPGTGSGPTSGFDTSAGAYDVRLVAVGAPGPIDLSVVPSTLTVHPSETVTLDIVATHPDGFPVALDVRWSDDQQQRIPASGWSPSGSPQRHSRALHVSPWQQRTVTVTASDEWGDHGRTASTTLTVSVLGPDDRCSGGPRDLVDAPSAHRDWSGEDADRFESRAPVVCDGDVGYRPLPGVAAELTDVYRVELCGPGTVCDDGQRYYADLGETLEVEVSASDGLSADVVIHALTYDDGQYPYGPLDTNEDVDDVQDIRRKECAGYESWARQVTPFAANTVELACERVETLVDVARQHRDLRTSVPEWSFQVDSGSTRSFTVPAEIGGIYAIEITRRGTTEGTYRLQARHQRQMSPGFE